MKLRWRRVFLYFVPLGLNLALMAYLAWQLGYTPAFDRHTRLQMFALLYAAGGIVVGVSGVTAFAHATAREKAPRGWYVLSLVNTIVPTVLLLVMLRAA
jgi:heme/copper-type cytochrome/quinol oxidase subunit 2